jgi:hypothetical protein
MEFSPVFVVSLTMAIAGFIFGYIRGFNSGVRRGSDGAVIQLTARGYLAVRTNIEGEEEFVKHPEAATKS